MAYAFMDFNYLKRPLHSILAPTTARIFLAAVLVAMALSGVGCAWTQPPTPDDAIIAPYTISGTTDKVDAGQLMLVQKGLWAFRSDASSSDNFNFEPGAIVGFIPQKRHAHAHIYSVVLERPWGVLLQRLDSQPVTGTELRGDFVPVDTDHQLRRWGLCRGTSSQIGQNSCIEEASASTKWRIYRTDAVGRIVVPELDAWGAALPVQNTGLLIDGRSVMHATSNAKPPTNWLAVPAHQPGRSLAQNAPLIPHARIALQTSCPDIDFSQSFQSLEIFNSQITAPQSPIDTTINAIRTGADVLVRCKGDTIWVDIPSLYRPILSVAHTGAQGVPYGAMRPIALQGKSRKIQRATILLGAALATGSTVIADFYLQDILREHPDSDETREMGLNFMQVFAAAGRPEAALRSGHRATNGAWHVDNNPTFILGRTWIDAALGKSRAYSDDITRLSKMAESPDNADIRIWLAWSAIRAGAVQSSGRSVRGALGFFETTEQIRWIEAANLIVEPDLRIELKHGAANGLRDELKRAFLPEAAQKAAQNCAELGVCQLDVYGRNFAARLNALRASPTSQQDVGRLIQLLRDLSETSIAAIRPGFENPEIGATDFSPAEQLAIRAALMPMMRPEARAASFDGLIEAASRAVRADGNCVQTPGADIITKRLGGGENGATAEQPPLLEATRWLVSDAFDAACHSPVRFAESLDASLGHNDVLARCIIPLLVALSEHTTADARAQMLQQVAEFSARHKTGAACTRFNLALALSNANAGQLDVAAKNISKTVNCIDADSKKYAPSRHLLNAYLQFETSGQIPPGLAPRTHRALLQLTHAVSSSPRDTDAKSNPDATNNMSGACFGLEPIAYQLASYLHPDIVVLAVSLPEPEPEQFALETSSRSLERARAALKVAGRYLAEGHPAPAADSLLEAQAAFERINHQVGLRRISFLFEAIYGRDVHAYREAQKQDADAISPGKSKNKPPPIALDAPDTLSARDWSTALQQGQADAIGNLFDAQNTPTTPAATRAWTAAKLLGDDLSDNATQALSLYAKPGSPHPALQSLCK